MAADARGLVAWNFNKCYISSGLRSSTVDPFSLISDRLPEAGVIVSPVVQRAILSKDRDC